MRVQDALDAEFFENRYLDAPRADQLTLRVAGDLIRISSRNDGDIRGWFQLVLVPAAEADPPTCRAFPKSG
jgi:hypothetical protein